MTKPVKASDVDLRPVAAGDDLLEKQERRRAGKQRRARLDALTKLGVERGGSDGLAGRLEARSVAAQRSIAQSWRSRNVVAKRLKP